MEALILNLEKFSFSFGTIQKFHDRYFCLVILKARRGDNTNLPKNTGFSIWLEYTIDLKRFSFQTAATSLAYLNTVHCEALDHQNS